MTARKAPPPSQPLAALVSLADVGEGASLQAASRALAARMAAELAAGKSQAERVALSEFLSRVADWVRWPPRS